MKFDHWDGGHYDHVLQPLQGVGKFVLMPLLQMIYYAQFNIQIWCLEVKKLGDLREALQSNYVPFLYPSEI